MVQSFVFLIKKKPFGPWVSENYVACARILKSVYFSLQAIMENLEDKNDLLTKVLLLVTSWNAVVARLMQEVVTPILITDIERHINFF